MPDPKPPVARKIRLMLLLPMLLLSLGSCSRLTPMKNEAIIEEAKKCHDAGLAIRKLFDPWTTEIVLIQCDPRQSEAK